MEKTRAKPIFFILFLSTKKSSFQSFFHIYIDLYSILPAFQIIATNNGGNKIVCYGEDGAILYGNQKVDGGVYGKSITDPCLGWEKTEALILELADRVDY